MRGSFVTVVIALAACAVLALGLMEPASAIPAYAKEQDYTCGKCHSGYPRLNDFGRFYQMANLVPEPDKVKDIKSPNLGRALPIGMRTSLGYTSKNYKNEGYAEDINQFQINGLDIFSGGPLGKNISYFLVYEPEIKESSGVAGQQGKLDVARLNFDSLWGRHINLSVGRFEPAYMGFSARRQLSVSPYEIYDFTFLDGPTFWETQTGLELWGYCGYGFRWAGGWMNGAGGDYLDDAPSDVYLRFSKVFGGGQGQTSGQRLGLSWYRGRARPYSAPNGEAPAREGFRRIGLDGSFNSSNWNLSIQYLWCNDSAALWNTDSSYNYSGGFAQLNYLPQDHFVWFARHDWVNTPHWRPPAWFDQNIRRWTFGGRYYIEDNLALHFEYSHRTRDLMPGVGPSDASENYFTLRLDAAF